MDVASASDSNDNECDEDIVEVTEQEIDTESDGGGEDIGDNNNSRRQSTFSRWGEYKVID